MMPFPEAKRVIFKKNPLDSVVCQLRFPPILRIDTEIPSEFQEAIRQEFPNYEEEIEFEQQITPMIEAAGSRFELKVSKPSSAKNHSFSSEDNNWRINLTRTFMAITATRYTRWEHMQSFFAVPLRSLLRIYNPPFFTRIGLRYIDVFCRSKLGLDGVDWADLVEPYFLGILSSAVRKNVGGYSCSSEISLDNNLSKVRILTMLVKAVGTNEDCFMLDCDFFRTKRTKDVEIDSVLETLHSHSTRLLQFAIKKKLFESMEPDVL